MHISHIICTHTQQVSRAESAIVWKHDQVVRYIYASIMPMKHLGIADRGTCTTAWPHSAKADWLPAPKWVHPCEAIQERKIRHTHTHADVANMDMGQVLPGLWGSRLGSRRLPASAGNIPPVHPWKAGQGFRQRTSIWIHLAHEFFCKFNWTHFSLANCVLSFWMCSRRGYNIYILYIYIYI